MKYADISTIKKLYKTSRSLVVLISVLLLVLLLAAPVAAMSESDLPGPPEIANFHSDYANGILSFSGESAESVLAVAILLSDSDGNLIKAESVGINPDMTFAGTMEINLLKADTYTVSAANYEGGTATSIAFSYGTYSITYELNGGKNNPSNPSTYNIEDDVTLLAPTREGYTFDGWYTDSKLTEKTTGWAAGTTGDVVLYAKWTTKHIAVPKTGETNDGFGLLPKELLISTVFTLILALLWIRQRTFIRTT